MGVVDSEAAAFSRELAALKREGCNVLVVDDPGGERAACERLLGGHDLDRHHVFLSTSVPLPDVLARHGSRDRDASRFGVVDATGSDTTRSAVAAASTSAVGPSIDASDPEWYDELDDPRDLESLFAAVRSHLDRVVAGEQGAPGELRFCLDSLDPLVDAVPEESLFRFLHLLTSTVRDARGMGHVHATAGVSDETIDAIEPLFDATVHVETRPDGATQQRWVLGDADIETGWFELA